MTPGTVWISDKNTRREPRTKTIMKVTFLFNGHSRLHGGESRDLRGLKKWRILVKALESGKTFFDTDVNTGQICVGFEADTLGKMTATRPLYASFGQRSG